MTNIKILVRRNLKMSTNKTAAQCVHAALGLKRKVDLEHYAVIVLDASDKKFEETKELQHYVVVDAGLTEVEPGTETCLAYYEHKDP